MSKPTNDILQEITTSDYQWGFESHFESEQIPKGLSEDTVRFISAKKQEPPFMLEFRLKAFRHWLERKEPHWAHFHYDPIDYQDISYWSAPVQIPQEHESKSACNTTACVVENLEQGSGDLPDGLMSQMDPELLETFKKLGISLDETNDNTSNVAVDAVLDSVSIKTTHSEELLKHGVIFCSISEAVKNYPELVKTYLGSVVPSTDNYFAALNSAVFSDGSFVYIPKGVKCPMDLSTYFRINAKNTGQFERTLIIADEGASVSYMEGCTAPIRDENQLHAAVVEIVVLKDAEVKYSTVQNWYPGNKQGQGGIYNFVTKRGICKGSRAKLSWTQVETGSAITWKYPSVILQGSDTVGEFYSVAVTNNYQQADTGTKMIHIGKNSKSTIISKGVSAGKSQNSYRGLVKVLPNADGARNFSRCDSLLMGNQCGAHTWPDIQCQNASAIVEHEATTSKISEDQLFYCQQRGISPESAVGLIVNGYAKEVLNKLPMEFAVEAQKLLSISLEGSVG